MTRQADISKRSQWPAFDDPAARSREVFAPLSRTTLISGLLGLFVITPFIAVNKIGSALLSVAVLAAGLASQLCLRINRPRLGALIVVSAFWGAQTLLLVLSNGAFTGSAYVFVTLLAGLALGTRAGLVAGSLGVAALAITTGLSVAGVSLPVLFPGPYASRASFGIAILLAAMWTLHVFIRRMELAFATATREIAERRKAEAELQRRAGELEEAQRLTQSGSWEYDVATGEHRWSRQQFRVNGLDPDSVAPSFRAFIARVLPEDQDTVAKAFSGAYDDPRPVRGDYRVLREDGAVRIIDGHLEGEYDAQGKLIRLRGTSVDVTEQRLAERAMQESEARFRSLTKLSADVYWEQDEQLRFTSFVGMRTDGLGPARFGELHRKTWSQFECVNMSAADWAQHHKRLQAHEAFHDLELCRFAEAGRKIWIRVSGEPVYDAAGRFTGYRGVARDITERRRIDELRELEHAVTRCCSGVEDVEPAIDAVLKAICESEDWELGGYWRADEKSGVLSLEQWWVRPRFAAAAQPVIEYGRNIGFERGAGLLGLSWKTAQALWIPDVTQDVRATRAELLDKAGLRSVLIVPVTDGSRVVGVLLFLGTDTRAPDQAFLQAVPVIGSQIGQFIQRRHTELQRRALQAQLYQSQKLQAIGTLAGGIAHEFNNMIAAIIGNTAMARQDIGAGHPAMESLEQISTAAQRARDLTRRILLFGRAQPDARSVIPLGPVITEAMRLLRATLPARITLNLAQGLSVPPVRADATQLHQMLINLCTNAAQAIGKKPGSIDISLIRLSVNEQAVPETLNVPNGDYVRLSVADSGPGIEPALRDRIFEPFFTTKPAGEGTGLGLSVVHSIVQAHEGAIDLEHTPGRGATFHVYLPAATLAEQSPTVEQGLTASDNCDAHILYVDDDPSMVSLMERMLKRYGCRVSGYTSASKALDALRAAPQAFDLMMSDYNMAEMSGLDVAREALRLRPELAFVIISGLVDEHLERTGKALGVLEILHKPDLEEVCAAINRLAARK